MPKTLFDFSAQAPSIKILAESFVAQGSHVVVFSGRVRQDVLHDWQALVLRDPYFSHTDSRVDAQSADTPERSTSREWQTLVLTPLGRMPALFHGEC